MQSSDSLRQKVLDHFRSLSKVNYINHFVFHPPGEPAYFVKYGDEEDVLVEAKTQTYFYNLAQQDDSAPRIPKVYEVFSHSGECFSVMEYVTGQTLEAVDPSEAVSLATFALRWLLNQKLPSHAFGTVGCVEGSCVRHHFFKDNRAPYAFANAQALEIYVNKAISRSPKPRPPPISFESTPCVIYHSDIKKDNFLVDANGCVWMVDFQHIGVLPLPFSQFAFYYTDNAFATAVGKALNIEKGEHAALMARASTILKQSGNDSLGLNRFGEPVSRTSSGSGKSAPVSASRDGG